MRYDALKAVVRFDEHGLIPAIIQDAKSREVLTLCYLNREALRRSLAEGRVHVFRRSQQRVMLKGETSGHLQRITGVSVDCEGKSLLILVRQRVAACHTGYVTCYYREVRAARLSPKGRRVFDPSTVYG